MKNIYCRHMAVMRIGIFVNSSSPYFAGGLASASAKHRLSQVDEKKMSETGLKRPFDQKRIIILTHT